MADGVASRLDEHQAGAVVQRSERSAPLGRALAKAAVLGRLPPSSRARVLAEVLDGLRDPGGPLAPKGYMMLLEIDHLELDDGFAAAAIESADVLADRALAAQCLVLLGAQLPEPQGSDAQRRALEIIAQLEEEERSDLLETAMPVLALAVLPLWLDIVEKLEDRRRGTELLAIAAPRLPDALIPTVLEICIGLEWNHSLQDALAGMARRMTSAQAESAATRLFEQVYGVDFAELMEALMPGLSLDYVQRLTRMAPDEDPVSEARLLAAAAARLEEGERAEAVKRAVDGVLRCTDDYTRDRALEVVAPLLSASLLDRVIEPWFEVDTGLRAIRTVVSLSQCLPDHGERLSGWTLRTAQQLVRPQDRVEAITVAAKMMAPSDAARALELVKATERARQFERPSLGKALVALAPRLPEKELEPLVDLAAQLDEERQRSEALAAAAAVGGPKLAQKVIEKARRTLEGFMLSPVVAGVAPHLSLDQLDGALDDILRYEMDDTKNRAVALRALSLRLSPDQLDRAVRAAQRLRYDNDREQSVAGLIPAVARHDAGRAIELFRELTDSRFIPGALQGVARELKGDPQLDAFHALVEGLDGAAERARGLAALMEGLSGDKQADAIRSAVRALDRADHPDLAADVIGQLMAIAGSEPTLVALLLSLSAQPEYGPPSRLRVALVACSSQLSSDVADQLLTIVQKVDDPLERSAIAALLAGRGSKPASAAMLARVALAQAARQAAVTGRPAVFEVLSNGPVGAPVIDPATIGTLIDRICDLCDNWRWP